jgi:hypothetical protein
MNNNKKFNTDNYFSDDEVNQDNQIDECEESDDSLDEETRRIIYQSISRNMNWDDLTYNVKKEPVKKKQSSTDKPMKTKNVLSLGQFVQKIDIEEKTKQPKKFVSKRVEEKRKQFGVSEDTKPKRSFNPRMPPYNFVHGKKEPEKPINFSNNLDFPSFGKS